MAARPEKEIDIKRIVVSYYERDGQAPWQHRNFGSKGRDQSKRSGEREGSHPLADSVRQGQPV